MVFDPISSVSRALLIPALSHFLGNKSALSLKKEREIEEILFRFSPKRYGFYKLCTATPFLKGIFGLTFGGLAAWGIAQIKKEEDAVWKGISGGLATLTGALILHHSKALPAGRYLGFVLSFISSTAVDLASSATVTHFKNKMTELDLFVVIQQIIDDPTRKQVPLRKKTYSIDEEDLSSLINNRVAKVGSPHRILIIHGLDGQKGLLSGELIEEREVLIGQRPHRFLFLKTPHSLINASKELVYRDPFRTVVVTLDNITEALQKLGEPPSSAEIFAELLLTREIGRARLAEKFGFEYRALEAALYSKGDPTLAHLEEIYLNLYLLQQIAGWSRSDPKRAETAFRIWAKYRPATAMRDPETVRSLQQTLDQIFWEIQHHLMANFLGIDPSTSPGELEFAYHFEKMKVEAALQAESPKLDEIQLREKAALQMVQKILSEKTILDEPPLTLYAKEMARYRSQIEKLFPLAD